MNDQELTNLLRQAAAQTPAPSAQLSTRTVQAYRTRFSRPSFVVRHWRVAAVVAAGLVAIGVLGTRSSTGSPLPPEYERPHVIASGSVRTQGGWTMEYSTVIKPVVSEQRFPASTSTVLTEPKPGKAIFHRYAGDVGANTLYGYDIVLRTDGMSGKVTLQPPSEPPAMLMDRAGAADVRFLAVQELPSQTFDCGQTIAVTLLADPATGQKVVDYVRVDTSFFSAMHHIMGNMIKAFHSHFNQHSPSTVEPNIQ
jgi:hypothetical protein